MWVQRVGGGVNALAYAPDARTLFTHDGTSWVYGWDVAKRLRRKVFHLTYDEQGRVYRDGLYTVGGRYLIVEPGGRTRGLDLVANAPLEDLAEKLGYGATSPAWAGPVVHFITRDRMGVGAYDLVTGRQTCTHTLPPGLDRLAKYALSPDGSAALVDESGRAAFVRPDGSSVRLPDSYASGVRVSPDGRSLLWLDGGSLQVVDTADLSVRLDAVPCYAPWATFAFHPTEPVFAAVNPARELTLFRLDTGAPIRSFDFAIGNARCVAFAPDGLTCAVGGSNRQFAVFDVDL